MITLSDIKAHVITIILCAALIGGGVWGIESLIARHDANNDAKWQTLLAQVEAKNDAEISQINNVNAALLQSIATRDKQYIQVAKVDASLPSPQIAQKLGGTAPDANTITLPLDTARSITAQLDDIPVLKADLADETAIAANDAKVISDLGTQLQVEQSACKAQVTAIKAADRKSKLRWFGIGFVAGAIARTFIP